MKNKKNIYIIIFYLFLFVFGVAYLYCYRMLVDDELFNYGFAKSILDGRIPYLDFNMIIPPLFPYLLSIVIGIFGKHLLVYHCVLVLFSIIIYHVASKEIGIKAIALYCLTLIYPYTGYNTFCLVLFMLLLYVNHNNSKNSELLEAFLISCMFLTKHTLGLLVIPSIIMARRKKKVLAIYVTSLLLFLLYLLVNRNLFQFLDYCVLGMFNFASKNGNFSYFFAVELIIIIFILVMGIKNKKKEYFYLLCFQIMAFPIPNYAHFFIPFIPVVYYFLLHLKNNFCSTMFFMGFAISFFLIFSLSIYFKQVDYSFTRLYPGDSFMKGRRFYSSTSVIVSNASRHLSEYSDYDVYILGSFSYLLKLNLDLPIDKYDIINYGNMGYAGSEGYILEIDKKCADRKCVFIINDLEALGKVHNQVDVSILKYVKDNYFKEYSSSYFSIYVNKKSNYFE